MAQFQKVYKSTITTCSPSLLNYSPSSWQSNMALIIFNKDAVDTT